MKEQQTPLMKQYHQIKAKHPDTVLLFRMGDFFETFGDDAVILSQVAGITLTKRNHGDDTRLAGFPHHQIDTYLPKLVRAGYRVAVCEQLEDPKFARGIVKRGVIEVVTPGVAIYDKLLESNKNNYVASIIIRTKGTAGFAGIAFADVSTGEFQAAEVPLSQLATVLDALAPAEIIVSKAQRNEIDGLVGKLTTKPFVNRLEEWIFDEEFARQALLGHFRVQSLKGFGLEYFTAGIAASGAVLYYIKETQQGQLEQIKTIRMYDPNEYMLLDYSTRRNLEIVFSQSEESSSLVSVIDRTQTPMGSRLLKGWLTRPLKDLQQILRRKSAVKYMADAEKVRSSVRSGMAEVGDLERLIAKACASRATPRDMVSLKRGLLAVPALKQALSGSKCEYVQNLADRLQPVDEVTQAIDFAISEEAQNALGSGTVFNRGYSRELDEYTEAKSKGKDWIASFQERERETTGIPSLKVGFNNVAGYYIEITNTHKHKAPEHYTRKGTLTNAERYSTDELKDYESKILGAEEKILELERSLFTSLLARVAEFTASIQSNAATIAEIDCLAGFAEVAIANIYTEPIVDDSREIHIDEGRHPVVEKLMPVGESFTRNSTMLNPDGELIHIITGPNMSGKSCYLRQVALIVLLAQVGSFVPAKEARIGVVDRIFTRVGAQDNIAAGESTFLVEMQEAANIMNNATESSLILLDEVGRGTATFDGISIAWAISEFIHDKIQAKTLFATHYHELNNLTERYENIANYQVETIESGDTVIFSHRVKPGASDHSFGIHVARMAGMPQGIIDRADEIMRTLESDSTEETTADGMKTRQAKTERIRARKSKVAHEQMSIFEFRDDLLRRKILDADINNMTPFAAFQLLAELIEEAKK